MGSMTLAMITVGLVSIMFLVVRGFTSKDRTQEAIAEIVENSTPNQILSEYKRQSKTLKLAALGGGLLTLMFAMTFFSGDELNPLKWGFGQWFSVAVGVVVVFAITMTQYNLYQDIEGNAMALLITVGILVFIFYSEIASTAERESELVKARSVASPTLQAAIGAIGDSNAAIQAPTGHESMIAKAQGKKAQHEIELKRCDRHKPKGAERVERCVTFESKKIAEQQAIIDQYKQSANASRQAIVTNTQGLINQAKALEYDENQHAAIVKFFKGAFGVSALSGAMFAAFLLVNAFELGFHYSGSRVGQLRAALAKIGYDLQTDRNDFEVAKGHMDLIKLRDAAKTTEEIESLKAKIKELTSSSPALKADIPENAATAKREESAPVAKANHEHVKAEKSESPIPENLDKSVGFDLPKQAPSTAEINRRKRANQKTKNQLKDAVSQPSETTVLEPSQTVKNTVRNESTVSQPSSPSVSTVRTVSENTTNGASTVKGFSDGQKQTVLDGAKNEGVASPEKRATSDTDLIYPEWKKAVEEGGCKLGVKVCRKWVVKHLGAHTSKQVKKVTDTYAGQIVELLYMRGLKDGLIIHNPNFKEGVIKYLKV